jgi:hypothetical protein
MLNRIGIVFIILLIASTSFAATVPTGIPEPPFGLDETVANTVGTGNNDYYTYWVDNSGSCSDGGKGKPASPRCTFPSAGSLIAGDVVQVRGGPYSFSHDYVVSGTGTTNEPIFVRGPDKNDRITINLNGSNAIAATGSYIIIENFKFTNQDEAFGASGSDHCVLRYCEIQGTGTTADGAGQTISPGGSTYLVAAYNFVHDGGDWQNASQNDMHGLGTGSHHSYTWYLYNTVYHMGGDGVGNSHSANHTSHHVYVGGNTIYQCRENAIDLKEIHDVILSENEMHSFSATNSSNGSAMVIHYGPNSGNGPFRIWVINNIIHDSVYGISTSDNQNDIYYIGNVLFNLKAGFYHNSSSGGEYFVYHNTIVDTQIAQYWGAGVNGLDIEGNVAAYASTAELRVEGRPEPDTNVANELYYDAGSSGANIFWDGKTYNSVSEWIIATHQGNGSVEQNPLFSNYSDRDFSIQSGSPCINSGKDMSAVMSAYNSSYGASLNKDINGTTRPSGVWDIGAYESGASPGGGTVVAAPKNLKVVTPNSQ